MDVWEGLCSFRPRRISLGLTMDMTIVQCAHSLMDRIKVSGTFDAGSIPAGRTQILSGKISWLILEASSARD
jgi:hypothetical protein